MCPQSVRTSPQLQVTLPAAAPSKMNVPGLIAPVAFNDPSYSENVSTVMLVTDTSDRPEVVLEILRVPTPDTAPNEAMPEPAVLIALLEFVMTVLPQVVVAPLRE